MAGWRLVLVMTAVVVSGWMTLACPDHCSCRHEQGLYVANCSSLPSSGGKIESLTLLPTHTHLELVDGQFNSARHLKYLNLRNCSIYFIHKKTFYGAKNIIEIDLSYNQIEEIEPTVFQHLTSLTTLILRGNPIQFLFEVPFLISNSLQHLDIGDCKIKHIPRGVFYGLKRMKYLSLDKNLLKSIKYNSLPKGLKYIDLSNNLIVNVPTEVILSLTNLRRLGLGGNPINCSCALLNLQDWLSGQGVIFEDDVVCALPPQYKGVSWSKVDENSLCLAEARREEMYQSFYSRMYKNKLYRDNYFENENNYQGENLQSDQPQPYSNSDSEILFQNNDTLAMGEMMRDEDGTSLAGNTETNVKNNSKSENLPELYNTDSEGDTLETHNSTPTTENQEPIVENGKTQHENSETVVSESHDEDTKDIPHVEEEEVSELKDNVDDVVSLNNSKPIEFKTLGDGDSNTETDDLKNEGLLHAGSDLYVETNSTAETSTVLPVLEDTTEDELPSTEETPTFNQEDEDDLDYGSAQNVTSSTETNNGTILEYPNSLEEEEEDEEIDETIPPPTLTGTLLLSTDKKAETNSSEVVAPKIEPEVTVKPDATIEPEVTVKPEPSIEPEATIEPEITTIYDTHIIDNRKELLSTKNNEDEKIKQVAGAEVVMFCVGVLIICLILYSVYRCRTSKKRQNMRIVKDKPSNRDTEMQDMASLLPKPQDDDMKNNSKYPDKAPSSETEKLISCTENEKEPQKLTPISEAKGKIEDKNTLNNNTPDRNTSPMSKTPLIQPQKPITINPAAPIQRTKVKVGIIPDSIPRTPIFLQKTYNGTKNV